MQAFFRLCPEFYFKFIGFQKQYSSNRSIMVSVKKRRLRYLSNADEYAVKPEYRTVRYLFMVFRRYPL